MSTAAARVTAKPALPAREVLATVFDRCATGLYRYIMVRVGHDTHLADDLLQQLWIHACKLSDTPASELEYRLRAIARNLVRTHWRRVGTRPAQVPLVDRHLAANLADQLVSVALPEHVLAQREAQDQLLLALTELPTDQQRLIIDHYFENRSQAELARTFGSSTRAIEGRLYRARQALRERLRHLEPY